MKVDGVTRRTIWPADDGWSVDVIDQTRLPHEFAVRRLSSLTDAADAIRTMVVRGAPLIGATAAYGMCLALHENPSDEMMADATGTLLETRPTAVNLRWALERMSEALRELAPADRKDRAYAMAAAICEEDVEINRAIGAHGQKVLLGMMEDRRQVDRLNVLTHCNAGWLATVDWGTALAPIYMAHDAGHPVHVWVDETRPRNQGAGLTAWELLQHGVPHTVISDNSGGHLMQRDLVDVVITGTDRTTATGDVCNKVGTYLKALAAKDNGVPFYVALPGPTIDWTITDGIKDIPIEQRDAREVSHITGRADDNSIKTVRLTPEGSPVRNDAFDVTPARLVTGLITDRGVCPASAEGLSSLFGDRAAVK